MMSSASVTGIVLALSLCVQWQLVVGQYVVQVSVYSYSNPSGQCEECRETPTADTGCCDSHIDTNPDDCDISQLEVCDIFLTFCPRPPNTTDSGSQCPENSPNTRSLPTEFNIRNFTFDPISVINHRVFSPWNGTQVYVVMNDDDFGTPRSTELIDSFAIDVTIPVGTVTNRTTYNGQFGRAQVDLSFHLTCMANYFGADCSRFCNITSNCSCDPDYTGEFCQTVIDNCDETSLRCNGRGQCVDGVNSFTCVCEPGYTGPDCETDINECAEVVCGLNMHCEDGLNNYTCVCDSGYSGTPCNQEGSQQVGGPVVGGVVGGLLVVVALLTVVVVMVAVILYIRRRKDQTYEFAHGYDVVGPPVRYGTPPTQEAPPTSEAARDRTLSEPMYEIVQDSGTPAHVDVNTLSNVSYKMTGIEGEFSPSTPNERKFDNPLYGDNGGLSNVWREFDNPVYGEEDQLDNNPIYGEGETHNDNNPIYGKGETHIADNPIYGEGETHIADNPIYGEGETHIVDNLIYGEEETHIADNPIYGEGETHIVDNPIYGEGETHIADNPIYGEGETHIADNPIYGMDDDAHLELIKVAATESEQNNDTLIEGSNAS